MIHHVYANQSNVGDWLSALGIQKLLGVGSRCDPAANSPLQEHFCDDPSVDETLDALSRATPEDLIIIGGGGLFMDCFSRFWNGFRDVAERVPFAIWGVGACELERGGSRLPQDLIGEIAERSRLCVVRDELTCDLLSPIRLPPPVVCPCVAAVAPGRNEDALVLHVDHYNSVGPENFERMCAAGDDFAAKSGRLSRRTNNLIEPGNAAQLDRVLGLYRAAGVVLSSRLHGCILAVATGRPVLAVSGDRKVESFMRAAGLGDWVLDLDEIESVPERLAGIHLQRRPVAFVDEARRRNRAVAACVGSLIAERQVSFF